jgi:hypothetical protein
MQTALNNFQKITTGTRQIDKANKKQVLPFYHFSNKSYELSKLTGSEQQLTLKPYHTVDKH